MTGARRRKLYLYGWAGISAIAEGWLTHKADAGSTPGQGEVGQRSREWIFIKHKIPTTSVGIFYVKKIAFVCLIRHLILNNNIKVIKKI